MAGAARSASVGADVVDEGLVVGVHDVAASHVLAWVCKRVTSDLDDRDEEKLWYGRLDDGRVSMGPSIRGAAFGFGRYRGENLIPLDSYVYVS
jgi:hypothetical protein